jgi:hypothetical protein
VSSLLLGAALNESGAMLVARICGAALIVVVLHAGRRATKVKVRPREP